MATMLENCRIHPSSYSSSSSSSSSSNQEFCSQLTHFDIPFLQSDPTQRLIFFGFHCSIPHFHENILPSLKSSLSLTLTHFLPLVSNILLPLNSGNPVIRHISGDSVSLTIAQSDQDFHYLTSNHQRVADDFYGCVPQLPPATRSTDSIVFPVVALQITLFPDQGICIGITNHHAVCDGSSTVNFVKAWACANRLGDAEAFHQTVGVQIPIHDRTLVEDPENLACMAWKIARNRDYLPVERPPTVEFPINRIRSTFLLTKDQIQALKNHVSAKMPNLGHISSFTVISAYVWICSEKAALSAASDDDDEQVYFSFAADCRRRLNPPLPESYFGNCLVFVRAESRRGSLKTKDGFLIAVERIAEAIRTTLNSEDHELLEAADWPFGFRKLSGKSVVSVAGSPRFDVYEADFGWGKAKKHEFVHLDRERSISLFKSSDFEGGFEIGLSRKKAEMDVFEDVFRHVIVNLC